MAAKRSGPGRPKKDPALVRDYDLRIPLTEDEKETIRHAASVAGETGEMAQWARGILLAAAKQLSKQARK